MCKHFSIHTSIGTSNVEREKAWQKRLLLFGYCWEADLVPL